ncbi:putative NKAP family protein [Blattamonas nauphoetae]|uniref:NKAP family protein n=1 Tax=Blattamonas nauphoetae TaxID=2049346 RepID=A0ABQ9Y6M5_9EUKA|nr:putative NKAP family protein [Blattamonas nauphoetae]
MSRPPRIQESKSDENYRAYRIDLRRKTQPPHIWGDSPPPPKAYERRQKHLEQEKKSSNDVIGNDQSDDSIPDPEPRPKKRPNLSPSSSSTSRSPRRHHSSRKHKSRHRHRHSSRESRSDRKSRRHTHSRSPSSSTRLRSRHSRHSSTKRSISPISVSDLDKKPQHSTDQLPDRDSEDLHEEINVQDQRKFLSAAELREKALENAQITDSDGKGRIGPQPAPRISMDEHDYGGQLLPGEGTAMAAFVQQGKRIPRRGEIGLTPDEISHFEDVGFVMSGSRHKRMNAVRIRKESQVYSAEEKKALAQFEAEQKQIKEQKLIQTFREQIMERKKEAFDRLQHDRVLEKQKEKAHEDSVKQINDRRKGRSS